MDQEITEQRNMQKENDEQILGRSDFMQQTESNIPQSVLSHLPKNRYNRIHVILMGLFILSIVACVSYVLGMFSQKSSDMAVNPYLKVVVAPTEAPVSVTPTPDPTANWQTYTNQKYIYSVKYPTSLTANEQTSYYYYVTFDLPANTDGSHSLPPYLVSVIPDSFTASNPSAYNYMDSNLISNLIAAKIGTVEQLDSSIFTKLADESVAGEKATVVNVKATEIQEQRVYIAKNNYLYMFSTNYQSDSDLANFKLFLSTVKFY